MRTVRSCAIALLGTAGILAAAFVLAPECAFGGGMPGWYRTCACLGIERVVDDRTAADGPRRSVCLGVVTARHCHAYPGGPAVPCGTLPPR
jgi:hypothetical protein